MSAVSRPDRPPGVARTSSTAGRPGLDGGRGAGRPGAFDPEAAQAVVEAQQQALAGEHAAVWATGRAAGELSGAAKRAALADLERHRRARDQLRRAISGAGAQPVGAAPAYVEPFRVRSAASARRLMAHVLQAQVPVYADLAAALSPGQRLLAARTAQDRAERALYWGASASAFPGT